MDTTIKTGFLFHLFQRFLIRALIEMLLNWIQQLLEMLREWLNAEPGQPADAPGFSIYVSHGNEGEQRSKTYDADLARFGGQSEFGTTAPN